MSDPDPVDDEDDDAEQAEPEESPIDGAELLEPYRHRSKSVYRHKLSKKLLRACDEELLEIPFAVDANRYAERPTDRSECRGGPRPCPFVSCRYHLALDAHETGTIRILFPEVEVWDYPPGASCALDVADGGPRTLEEIGRLLGVTREAVRLEVERAIAALPEEARALLGEFEDTLPDAPSGPPGAP